MPMRPGRFRACHRIFCVSKLSDPSPGKMLPAHIYTARADNSVFKVTVAEGRGARVLRVGGEVSFRGWSRQLDLVPARMGNAD
jgi:hypothetical protein